MHKFKVGDIIVPLKYLRDKGDGWEILEREILDINQDGYGWCYPHLPKDEYNYWITENSSDPELFYWELKEK